MADSPKILLISGNLSRLIEFSQHFQSHGWAVGMAESLDDAQQLFRLQPPKVALVLVDSMRMLTQAPRLVKSLTVTRIVLKLDMKGDFDIQKLGDKLRGMKIAALLTASAGKAAALDTAKKVMANPKAFQLVDPKTPQESGYSIFPNPTHVILIDDSNTIRKIVETYLTQSLGYSHFRFTGFADAESFLESNLYTSKQEDCPLLLLDHNLPGMNGIELAKELRKSETWRAIPRMMLTSMGHKERLVEALQSGIVEFIVKPFTPDLLLRKINLVLHNSYTGRASV